MKKIVSVFVLLSSVALYGGDFIRNTDRVDGYLRVPSKAPRRSSSAPLLITLVTYQRSPNIVPMSSSPSTPPEILSPIAACFNAVSECLRSVSEKADSDHPGDKNDN